MKKAEREYYAKVRELGCVICGQEAVIHHKTGAGMALKADYTQVFPLCPLHHNMGGIGVAIHSGTKTWEANNNSQDYWIKWTQQQVGYGE